MFIDIFFLLLCYYIVVFVNIVANLAASLRNHRNESKANPELYNNLQKQTVLTNICLILIIYICISYVLENIKCIYFIYTKKNN